MAAKMEDEAADESQDLLYDILVYREWPQTPDHRSSSVSEGDGRSQIWSEPSSLTASSSSRNTWRSYLTGWKSVGVGSGGYPPQMVTSLLQCRTAWKFCLSSDGTLLAVLQESQLELYTSRDNFATSLAKVRLPKDANPHLRLLAWSPDNSLLVVTSSNGAVDLYDAFGYLVYSIFSQRLPQQSSTAAVDEVLNGPIDAKGYAYAGAFFTDYRVKSRDWLCELILVDFKGKVNSFLLSPSGYQEFTSFNLKAHHYTHGVTSVVMSSKHGLLCVAGQTGQQQIGEKNTDAGPSVFGLTCWRLLSDTPHYELVLPHDYVEPKSRSWFTYSSKTPEQDHIFSLEESPDGQKLCSLHVSGKITVWSLPGLRHLKTWHLEEQPCHDDMNPALMQNPRLKKRKRQFLKQEVKWAPLYVKWWSDEAVVVSRFSGGVTILSLKDADRNLLGESAEFFSGAPALSNCFGRGFFVLERETSTRKQNAQLDESDDIIVDDENDSLHRRRPGEESEDSSSEDDEDSGLLVKGKKAATSFAYLITESERFAPPRKRQRMTYHTYKLLALLSTTPEELYARKIEMEEYGEALMLAQHYGLDSDQVYDRQWKLSNLSTTAITDYLTKIKRRSLVLKECLNTVPTDVEAIRALLEYGLQETDLEVLSLMGSSENEGRFVVSSRKINNPKSDYYLSEEEEAERKVQEEQRLVSSIDWDNLTVSQRDLIAHRRTLLKYLDRLDAYLAILESSEREASYFDKDAYVKFRDQPLLAATIEFAHKGRSGPVWTLLDRYSQLRDYQLFILDNFPESVNPDKYADLIPSVDELLVSSNRSNLSQERELTKDWTRFDFVLKLIPDNNSVGEESVPPEAKIEVLTKEMVTTWVHKRARQIESESSLADNALRLLEHAYKACGVQVDLRLHHYLTTLEAMMYGAQRPSYVSLDEAERMSNLELLVKLMEGSNKETFLCNVQKFLVPYLDRLEQLEAGSRKNLLQNYLLHCAATSLVFPYELIKSSQQHHHSSTASGARSAAPVFMSYDECVAIGIDCIFAYEAEEEDGGHGSEMIVEIAAFLKKRCRNPHIFEELEDILDIMRSIKLLKRYGVNKSLHYFKACRNNQKAMEELFTQVTRRAEGRRPRISTKEWASVLQDLFELRSLLPVVSSFYCIEILCESLLCSENEDNLKVVKDIFDYSPADALFKGKSAMLHALSVYKVGNLPLASRIKIVGQACEYYLDSSKDVDDSNLGVAKKCLDLVKEKPDDLRRYYDVLTALEMLHEFGLSVLPVVLRKTTNYQPIVAKILAVDESAYKNVRKILKIARCLYTEKEADLDEGPILLTLGEAALKASDFDVCLSICEMMMASPTKPKQACEICMELINCAEFANNTAKAKLAAFCINFCEDDDIEDMLVQRITLTEGGLSDPPPAEERSVSPQVVEALTRITEKTTTLIPDVSLTKLTQQLPTNYIPVEAGTRVVNSLFNRLTKLAATNDDEEGVEDDSKHELQNEDEKELDNKTSRAAINVFYEDVMNRKAKLGKLHAAFDNYAASTDGPVDITTLSLLSQHYRNCFEFDDEEKIEWSIVKDIIAAILQEDSGIGIALLLAERSQNRPDILKSLGSTSRTGPFLLYLASLHTVITNMQSNHEAAFKVRPLFLFGVAKKLAKNSPVMQEALERSEIDLTAD